MMTEDQIQFSNYTRPICLPDNSRDEPRSDTAIATGWGWLVYNATSRPNILQEVVLNFTDDNNCHQMWNKVERTTIRPAQICTLSRGKDVGQGDSGGPLVEKSKIFF